MTKLAGSPPVLLFDELPCIHIRKSGFLEAFGHWWNTWASRQPLVKVVICGSVASWMIEHILNNKGGLHNGVSRTIRLLPFILRETEAFLTLRGVKLNRYQILQLYLAMEGVPKYLKQVSRGKVRSRQSINYILRSTACCAWNLRTCTSRYSTMPDTMKRFVRFLAKKAAGLSRTEIISG